jgi:hypothetical protein
MFSLNNLDSKCSYSFISAKKIRVVKTLIYGLVLINIFKH